MSTTGRNPGQQPSGYAGGGYPGGYPYSGKVDSTGGAGDLLDLRYLFSILRRRWILILGLTCLATITAAIYAWQIVPLYRASAQILFEPHGEDAIREVTGDRQESAPERRELETQAVMMTSSEVISDVILRKDLATNPAFNPRLQAAIPTTWVRIQEAITSLLGIGSAQPEQDFTAPELADLPDPRTDAGYLNYLSNVFRSGLTVSVAERTNILTIQFVSSRPELTALAVNAVAEGYLEQRQDEQIGSTADSLEFLEQQAEATRLELVEARRALAEFQQLTGGPNAGEWHTQQQILLNQQRAEYQNNVVNLQAYYNQVQRALENPGEMDNVSIVMESPMVQNLRTQMIEQRREIEELSQVYRDGHPAMIQARANLNDLLNSIAGEIRRIGASIRGELEVAQRNLASVNAQIAQLEAQAADRSTATVTQSALEAEVDTLQSKFDRVLEEIGNYRIREEGPQQTPARIITYASVPGQPFHPNRGSILFLAFGSALAVALILAVGLEFIDTGYRSLTQIEAQMGVPTFGMIPLIPAKKGDSSPHVLAAQKQGSIFAEAVRTLRTSLTLSNPDKPPRIVLVTSSMPNEGKTSTVLSIAAQTAKTGRRCIVIDCDLRKASIDRALGYSKHPGLGDYLLDEANVTDIICVDPDTGIHFIGAGEVNTPPVELMGSTRMRKLLKALADTYHLVILDTSPILAVADAMVLLREADAIVYLVRWEKTRRDIANSGAKAILDTGVDISGVVLTYVDVKRHSRYTYSDSGYYYNKAYKSYYTS